MSSFKAGPDSKITAYTPYEINSDKTPAAQKYDFADQQSQYGAVAFEIDPSVSNSIGLADAKNKEQQKKFDGEVLKFVQKIKDGAFQEAYDKGLEEGIQAARQQAYDEAKQEIQGKIDGLVEVMKGLGELRQKMYEINEKEIVNFCYSMAQKVVFKEIEKDPTLIAEAIKHVATQKEELTLKMSPADYDFMQTHMDKLSNDMNISKIRFEKDEALQRGDLSLESEQGLVDATLDTRLKKLKQLLDGLE